MTIRLERAEQPYPGETTRYRVLVDGKHVAYVRLLTAPATVRALRAI